MDKMSVKMDISQCENITCECGCPYFGDAVIIKRVPGVMVGSSKDIEQPVQIFVCASCGRPRMPWSAEPQEEKSPLII
jgi:hypothetical protein